MTFVVRTLSALEDLLGWAGNLCLAILMLAVTADVCGRYFLNTPISGVYEISETYFMVAIVFLGLAQAQQRGAHVRVMFVLERLPGWLSRPMEVAYLTAAAVVFGIITYMSGKTGIENIALNRWTTGMVAIPTGPSWLIAAFGAGVLSLRLAVDAVLTASGVRKIEGETA